MIRRAIAITKIWVASDHHFRHKNILNYKDDQGELIRGKVFKDIDEHDNLIVEWHNELVKPQDHVYFLGDLAINQGGLEFVKKMNGHKRLVRGNHDIFKTKKYLEAGIDEIYGVRVFQNTLPQSTILSHIPLHPQSLSSRNWLNIHGHLHSNVVTKEIIQTGRTYADENYRCVSLEQTNYRPVLLME